MAVVCLMHAREKNVVKLLQSIEQEVIMSEVIMCQICTDEIKGMSGRVHTKNILRTTRTAEHFTINKKTLTSLFPQFTFTTVAVD